MREIVQIWKLLGPFHRDLKVYAAWILILEAVQVSRSYVFPLVLLLLSWNLSSWQWVTFVVAIALYFEFYIRLDTHVDWIIMNRVLVPIEKHLKVSSQEVFMGMELGWHQKRNSSALVGKVHEGVNKIQEVINMVCWELFPTLIQTLWSLGAILFLCWYVTPALALSFALFIWVSVLSERVKRPLRKERHDQYDRQWEVGTENVQSIATSLSFGQTQRRLAAYVDLTDGIMGLWRKEKKRSIFSHSRHRMRSLFLGEVLIFVILAYKIYQGQITQVNAFFVWTLCQRLTSSFGRFSNLIEVTNEATEGISRLGNLLAERPGIIDESNVAPIAHGKSVGIELRNVSFSYDAGSETEAISNISLNIKPGKVIALVGPSGSGKTTLPKLFSRKFQVTSGEVLVGGVPVNKWPLKQLRGLFSNVPQADDVFIFATTIADNIGFSREGATRAEIERAAYQAGLIDDIRKFKNGFDEVVGERGVRLSGGQKQRIALARAFLAQDRPILIMDEPTSAVDARTEKVIQDALSELLVDKTAVIIAHRLATIWNLADLIVFLENGQIKEVGTHEELMALGGQYSDMVELQTRVDKARAEAEAMQVEVLS